nr:S24 family peptidase [Streptomyces sp. NBC_01221]
MLQLSPSTFFARKTRPKPARRLRDEELIPLVTAAWGDSGRTYGARRITRALVRAGHAVNVAAMIDGEATVKRLERDGADVWLMPDNKAYERIWGNRATILGKAVTVLRNL